MSPTLPAELASAEALRDRVKEALASVEREDGPNYANLTDADAGLLSAKGGFITGYNAQAMVAPLLPDFPDLNVVLAEVQYPQAPWALALMKALPNLHMEISRFVSTDGMTKLLGIAGESRVLFGSRFPDSPLAAQLYHLHRYGLPESTLRALCGGNLDRLLGLCSPSSGRRESEGGENITL